MAAGFPGLGLGGLFTIVAALLRGVVGVGLWALGRRTRGQAAHDAGRALVALVMIVAGVASWMAVARLFDLTTLRVLGLAPVAVPLVVLAVVLGGAAALGLALRPEQRMRRAGPSR